MQELPERWKSLRKIALTVKHEVAPLQSNEVSVIRRKCARFEVSFKLGVSRPTPERTLTFKPSPLYQCMTNNWHRRMHISSESCSSWLNMADFISLIFFRSSSMNSESGSMLRQFLRSVRKKRTNKSIRWAVVLAVACSSSSGLWKISCMGYTLLTNGKLSAW